MDKFLSIKANEKQTECEFGSGGTPRTPNFLQRVAM
jgi:hypothetical protein